MNLARHPLMALAHPLILQSSPEDLRDVYEERAAIRTWLGGDVDPYAAELGAAREALSWYIEQNKEWLPPCSQE